MRLMNSRTFARLPPEPQMPAGLVELMEGLTREVLKNNPSNIYEFCTSHMQKLLEIRDGRAPKTPLTLEQKIKIAQEKVKQRAEERRRKCNEEIKSQVSNETEITTDSSEKIAVLESITGENQIQEEEIVSEDKDTLTPAQGELEDNVVPISYENVDTKAKQAAYVTSMDLGKSEEKDLEVLEVPEKAHLLENNGTTREHIDVEESSVNIINNHNIGDSDGYTKGLEGTSKSKSSSFDAFIEEESLPNEEDLNHTALLKSSQRTVEEVIKVENKSDDNNILINSNKANGLTENTVINTAGNDEYLNENDKDSDITEKSHYISTNKDISKKVEMVAKPTMLDDNKECSKSEHFFLDNENKDNISIAPENDTSNKTETNNVEDDTIKGVHTYINSDGTDVSAIQPIQDVLEKHVGDAFMRPNADNIDSQSNDFQHDIDPETVKLRQTRTEENIGKNVGSLLNNVVVINEAINFGNIITEHRNSNAETINGDYRMVEKIDNKLEQDVIDKLSSEKIHNVVAIIKDTAGINVNVTDIQRKVDINASAINESIKKADSSMNDDKEQNNYPEITVIDSCENANNSADSTKDKKTIVSEPVCEKKTVSILTVPLETTVDEGTITHKSPNTKDNYGNNNDQINVASYVDRESEEANESIPTDLIALGESNREPQIVDEVSKSNPQNEESDIRDESLNYEQRGKQRERDCSSDELNAGEHMSNMSESSDDPTSNVKTKVEPDYDTLENDNNYEDQMTVENARSDTMDLETAAITIQKHFRTFMYKRCSTFEDSSNDDHTSTDEDPDKEQTEYQSNKERRNLGLNRMESVLQTVNEEKSLSLSVDDSSSVSSAATVIQARVRGFLTRKQLRSSSIPMANSNSLAILDDQQKKTVLNIHIVPKDQNFSRDESMIESMDLSLDNSPPFTNLHPLGYDKSEPRKQLKREDAVQSFSPPSNNSDKQIDDIGGSRQFTGWTEKQKNGDYSVSDPVQDVDADSCDTPSRSTTIETVVEAPNYDKEAGYNPANSDESNYANSQKNSLDEMHKTTPLDDKSNVATPTAESSMDSESVSKLIHSGEFHDTLLPLSPTQISRNTTVVREFKNVLGYFLLWQ